MNKKILFSAGGTGGHMLPAINLMKHFFEKGYEVLLVTDKRGKRFIKNNLEFESYVIKTDTFSNKNFFEKIISFFIILYSILQSIKILKKEKTSLIISFGGYASFPISFASALFKLPLVIYENNLILGKTNKYLLPISKKILLSKTISKSFPEKFKNKIFCVGPILNKNIINYVNTKSENKNFSILILGGSQGAEIFGQVIHPVIKRIKDSGYDIEIIQQCIKSQKESLIDYYKKNNIKNYIFEFEPNILKLISLADLAITRCGASATAELAHTLTPFIAVPLANSINNHQYLNAKFYEESESCWILEENNFNDKNLFNLTIDIVKNKNKLIEVRNNMKKIYSNKVYLNIENQIKEFI